MKNTNILAFGSKAAGMLLPVIASFLLLGSCKKDEPSQTPVTEEEAVEALTQAIAPESGGLVLQTTTMAAVSLTNLNNTNCGVEKDSTVSKAGGSGKRTYAYDLNWRRMLTCNGAIPSAYQHSFSGNSSYATPRMSSSDQSLGDFQVSGLDPASTELTLNQTYERNGTQQSFVRDQRSFSSKVSITTTGLKINKLSREITAGAGTVMVSGTASTGGNFNYSGTIIFNGAGKATLVISSGKSYLLQW